MFSIFLYIIALFFSIILHEIAHGYVAKLNGDKTAEYADRLTLNPQKHIDYFGSILLPIFLYFSNFPVFGYAKPVPVNPYNIKTKHGMLFVSAAGIVVNFLLFLVTFFIIKTMFSVNNFYISPATYSYIAEFFNYLMTINIALFIFNLTPLPPFDGYKIIKELGLIKDNIDFEKNIIINIISVFVAVWIFGFIFKGIYDIISQFLYY